MINMSELIAVFLDEAKDLHQQLEQGLLACDASEKQLDPDVINSLFRAAHTIKGSAGVVGLEDLVSFTHVVETSFEFIRSGHLSFSPPLISCLLACTDHIAVLLDLAEQEKPLDKSIKQHGERLLQQLTGFMGNLLANEPVSVHSNQELSAEQLLVLIQFHADTFRDGFDPLALLRFLKTKATVLKEQWLFDAVPSFNQVSDAAELESCYLTLTVLVDDCTQSEVDEVFDFVRHTGIYFCFPAVAPLSLFCASLDALDDSQHTSVKALWHAWGVFPAEVNDTVAVANTPEETAKSPKPSGSPSSKRTASEDKRLMKVPAFKLDELVNQLGELVIATAALQAQANDAGLDALNETIEHIQQLVDDLQGNALNLRMVQIGETFNRFNRVIRDISLDLGKQVRLVIEGGDTELDKSMVERISDPLMHLVRNALDHGLETPDERVKSGKSPEGTLMLKAYHDSGSIVIEIHDDGRGINRQRVQQKALEKGLITSGHTLTDHDIDMLIFAAGFSTADAISNLSGRGVGMDVVRRNIEALRGTVQVTSQPGEGSCFELRLPLTLAIIDGFMVKVGASHFVIPLDLVTECIELNADGDEVDGSGFLRLRDDVLPYLHLNDFFHLDAQGVERQSVVVVKNNSLKVGLVVDELLGEFQTVIKPLGALFECMQGISGSSILGSGDIALILDVPKLIDLHLKRHSRVTKHLHEDS
ncbi:chemotaxis protein CheA [Alkalimonas sp. MEB108]|uniref:Chemotaxis protein CheA n=1 Tax=Alkalimonas cellulosilytica TaxID=3058395 RepID=A0ABU7J8G6_9GAMM|nr:chemotaxis protein CheA [Alkalimonas sp. MEB108]MEE2002302.1 chemotaxis protein CheA [Alkalimonas sp. MEB108]